MRAFNLGNLPFQVAEGCSNLGEDATLMTWGKGEIKLLARGEGSLHT